MSPLRTCTAPMLCALTAVLLACGGGGSSSSSFDGPITVPLGDNAPPPGPGVPSGSETDAQRQVWRDLGIQDYQYTLQRTVFGPSVLTDPVVVEVRGGTVVSRTYEQTGLPTDPQYDSWWPSIDGLFDIVQDAYDAGADSITVQYDPTFAYPSFASIDPVSGLADDEHAFTAGRLVILP